MMSPGPEPASPAAATPIDARIKTATIVVAAIAAGVLFFAVIGTIVVKPLASGREANGQLAIPLVSFAFFAMLASIMFRRVSFQPLKLEQIGQAKGEAGLAAHLMRTTIVSAALAEAVGIVGLVLGILTGETYYLYALCAISLFGVLSNYPRANQWRRLSNEFNERARAETTEGLGAGRR
jgi:hypothetical protein